MISHKNTTKAAVVMMAAAVMLCILAMIFLGKVEQVSGSAVVAMEYESALFNTEELMQIDIQMEEEKWEDMLSHASEEEYYSCDIVINGQKICNVGIRPKGNTSLSAIAMDPETDRFSLKLEFDHYMEGQTCFGLDKLILNNNYADATNMKEALVYDMYRYLGVDASLYNYAKISVNGEYWGVYLALEAVEESFMLRNYGTEKGALYKPDSMNMGGGHKDRKFEGEPPEFADGDFPGAGEPPEGGEGFLGGNEPSENRGGDFPGADEQAKSGGSFPGGNKPPKFGDGEFPAGNELPAPGGGFGAGSDGANLNYTDDDPDSYSAIWEGEVLDTGDRDHRRVVTALKNISEGTDLEKYLDIDNILKYMAVHTFSVNMDSLSGNMAHNYYLYESDGVLNILPWDYNLSFGGMNMGPDSSAAEMVNDAIDTPFQGTEFFDALLENEVYLSRYHGYLEQLSKEYVLGGRFQEVWQRIRSQIDALVETDPTALYSYEEYEAGVKMLYQTILLRAESIQGQLDGTIPATEEGQRADPESLVEASGIDVGVMGVFNMASFSDAKN